MLTLERAAELLHTTTHEEHLLLHAKNVMYAMGGMAGHFGQDTQHWMAIGYLHDYDYEQYPEEHLQHTAEPLRAAGLTEEEIRAILAHGYGLVNEVEPSLTWKNPCLRWTSSPASSRPLQGCAPPASPIWRSAAS